MILGLVAILYFAVSFYLGLLSALAWIYLFPPVVVRILFALYGKPSGTLNPEHRGFWVWYFSSQLQAIYLRFPSLEELLRSFPKLYSGWLRLWGSQIGKSIFWAPGVLVMDRTHLIIDDYVMIGFGARFTAHHLNKIDEKLELVLAPCHIEANAILGGLSNVGPGSGVAKGETLPSTMALAPFYTWREGRRHSTLPRKQKDIS